MTIMSHSKQTLKGLVYLPFGGHCKEEQQSNMHSCVDLCLIHKHFALLEIVG